MRRMNKNSTMEIASWGEARTIQDLAYVIQLEALEDNKYLIEYILNSEYKKEEDQKEINEGLIITINNQYKEIEEFIIEEFIHGGDHKKEDHNEEDTRKDIQEETD
jgi:hypothetical protein